MANLRSMRLVAMSLAAFAILVGCERDDLTSPESSSLTPETELLSNSKRAVPADGRGGRLEIPVKFAFPATTDTPTPQDEEFLDELEVGTFTVCKVAEGSTMQFTFETVISGPGTSDPVLYQPTVVLGDGECADVYTAPSGTGIDADLVSITEIVPDGWQIDRIAIWSRDRQSDGSFETTFHEADPSSPTVQGSIDAGKQGCVVIFYNSEVPTECTGEIGDFVWNDVANKGIQDAGEEGIPDVRVVLMDCDGNVLAETMTDQFGYYLFSGLCAGCYKVMVDESTIPDGWMQTPTEVGDDECVDNNPNPAMVTLPEDDSSNLCIDFGYMEPVQEGPGTGTPGYWHKPQRWPVDSIVIGGITYGKNEATMYLTGDVGGDKSINMFRHLVAAKLNVIVGNDDSCVAGTIEDADDWMASYPVGSGVDASSPAWGVGEPLKNTLDAYNNGQLCAPKRD